MKKQKNKEAKVHQKDRAEKQGLLDNVDLGTEALVNLQELKMSGGGWSAKFLVLTELSDSHRHYKATLFFNEQPFLDQITAIHRDIDGGLFKDEPVNRKNAEKQISRIEGDLEKHRDLCYTIEFPATVSQVKYQGHKGTQIVVLIEDKAIGDLNTQKTLIDKRYKIRLEPLGL